MTVPVLTSVQPATGPSSGGDLARLAGTGFAERVLVRFGGLAAPRVLVREEAGASFADVHTPAHEVGVVDVELLNLDAGGLPVPGEVAVLPGAYRFVRATVARQSNLTRIVRQLLRELKEASVPAQALLFTRVNGTPRVFLWTPLADEEPGKAAFVRVYKPAANDGWEPLGLCWVAWGLAWDRSPLKCGTRQESAGR